MRNKLVFIINNGNLMHIMLILLIVILFDKVRTQFIKKGPLPWLNLYPQPNINASKPR